MNILPVKQVPQLFLTKHYFFHKKTNSPEYSPLQKFIHGCTGNCLRIVMGSGITLWEPVFQKGTTSLRIKEDPAGRLCPSGDELS